jgi:hypothetical protein
MIIENSALANRAGENSRLGVPHGLMTTLKDQINEDLFAFWSLIVVAILNSILKPWR